jgi:hypothetical protein
LRFIVGLPHLSSDGLGDGRGHGSGDERREPEGRPKRPLGEIDEIGRGGRSGPGWGDATLGMRGDGFFDAHPTSLIWEVHHGVHGVR